MGVDCRRPAQTRARCTASPKIMWTPSSCLPALSLAPTSARTAGALAERSPAFRRSRCATSPSSAVKTTSCSAPSVAASTSSTTTRACATSAPSRWPPRVKLYPMKDAISFVRRGPFGGTGKGAQGEALFTAANPDYGAQITYSLKDPFWTSKKDKRVGRSGRRSARASPSVARRRPTSSPRPRRSQWCSALPLPMRRGAYGAC